MKNSRLRAGICEGWKIDIRPHGYLKPKLKVDDLHTAK